MNDREMIRVISRLHPCVMPPNTTTGPGSLPQPTQTKPQHPPAMKQKIENAKTPPPGLPKKMAALKLYANRRAWASLETPSCSHFKEKGIVLLTKKSKMLGSSTLVLSK